MSTIDPTRYKPRLRSYLTARGIPNNGEYYQCPMPDHADEHPSAYLYDPDTDDARLYCPVCEATMDVFDVAGLLSGARAFPEQAEDIRRVCGMTDETETAQPASPAQSAQSSDGPQPQYLPAEQAKRLFKRSEILRIGRSITRWDDAEITGTWPYLTTDGERVMLIDARFESAGHPGDKMVLSFWTDGKHIRAKKPPVVLYGLETLAGSESVCIHEGAKSAEAARAIPGFCHLAWNGGGKKARYADLSPLSEYGGPIYLYPDDDHQTDKNGAEKPLQKQPGYSTMVTLQKRLRDELGVTAKIVPPYPGVQEVKLDGADIVEALQIASPEDIARHITDSPEWGPRPARGERTPDNPPPPDDAPPHSEPSHGSPESEWPFAVLGTDDQGRAYFLGVGGRMVSIAPASIQRTFLLTLAPLQFWESEYPTKTGVAWYEATSDVIQVALNTDYDPDRIRGRGAWRERDGRAIFHDGLRTFGEPIPAEALGENERPNLYIRRPPAVDSGLDREAADGETRRRVFDTVVKMSWESKADCIRIMSWTVLGMFCGVLPWRPAGLLTGESGSGKSTVFDYVIRPLAAAREFTGGETSAAGIRQTIGIDSRNIVVEESDADTEAKEKARKDMFSLMRLSTSDNTPEVAKGSPSGIPVGFKMRSMFLFIAIDPEIDAIADENRIFRAKLVQPQGDWYPIRDELRELITPETGRRIRAFVWRRLGDILAHVEWIAERISAHTRQDIRWSISEAMLLSCYLIVWRDRTPEEGDVDTLIEAFYAAAPPEEKRDQASEIIDRLLDEAVLISGGRGESATLRTVLRALQTGMVDSDGQFSVDGEAPIDSERKTRYRRTVAMYGMSITRDGNVAIAANHHKIMQVLHRGRGYHHLLARHVSARDTKPVTIDGTTRRAVVFGPEILQHEEVPF